MKCSGPQRISGFICARANTLPTTRMWKSLSTFWMRCLDESKLPNRKIDAELYVRMVEATNEHHSGPARVSATHFWQVLIPGRRHADSFGDAVGTAERENSRKYLRSAGRNASVHAI